MMSKIATAQLSEPGVRFPPEEGVRGKNWIRELKVKNSHHSMVSALHIIVNKRTLP